MRRQKLSERPPPEGWVVSTEYQHHGRWLRPGTEFTVSGVRGRLRFLRYVLNENTQTAWIDGMSADKQFRSFRPDKIKTVHITTRMRENHG